MPFVGVYNGERVSPLSVESGVTVTCPACGGDMAVREGHYNNEQFISRHFFHTGGEGGCGGESDIHLRMKTIAAQTLEGWYPDGTVEVEKHIGDRFADVCVTFDTPRIPYGNGIVVEAQHKHKDKNIGAAGREFIEHGYSVFWAYQSDFEGHTMEFVDKRLWAVWPNTVPKESEWGGDGYEAAMAAADVDTETQMRVVFPQMLIAEIVESVSVQYIERSEWEEIETVWLHGKGRNLLWIDVYSHTGRDVIRFEVWQKDKRENHSEYITLYGDSECADRFEAFLDEAKQRVQEDESYEQEDGWKTLATAWLTGVEGRVWISLTKPPKGPLAWVFARKDRTGNVERRVVERRRGDIDRFRRLEQAIRVAEVG